MDVIFLEMSRYKLTFDLKINLRHSDLYGPVISLIFCSEKHFSLLPKPDSGELLCPATALISSPEPKAHKVSL